ncbi:MAG: hypothetical protein IJ875_05905 [Solobacterium sp.]|nr:hypothetical protein [Solobacterium sp.]
MLSLFNNKKYKYTYIWLAISCFCALFSTIYEYFSFGVYSPSMIFLFAYPLLLGAIPSYLLAKFNLPKPNRLWQDGVCLLTFMSLINGILEIYGTNTPYTYYFLIAGITLLAIGFLFILMDFSLGKE